MAPVTEMDVPFLRFGAASDTGGDTVYFDNVEIRVPKETGAERAALARVTELFEIEPLKTEVLARLRHDPKLDGPTRTLALAIASRREEDPQELSDRSWLVVREPGHSPAEYGLALRRLEEAQVLTPTSGEVLDRLGVAQLRLGRDREALETLTRADSLIRAETKTSTATNLAFQAIAQARLGRHAEAGALLDRVGELMGASGAPVADAVRVRDEAQAATRSTAAIDREQTVRGLQALGRAIQDFQADRKALPPPAIYSADGKPLLSWRVALLPFLGQKEPVRSVPPERVLGQPS